MAKNLMSLKKTISIIKVSRIFIVILFIVTLSVVLFLRYGSRCSGYRDLRLGRWPNKEYSDRFYTFIPASHWKFSFVNGSFYSPQCNASMSVTARSSRPFEPEKFISEESIRSIVMNSTFDLAHDFKIATSSLRTIKGINIAEFTAKFGFGGVTKDYFGNKQRPQHIMRRVLMQDVSGNVTEIMLLSEPRNYEKITRDFEKMLQTFNTIK